MSSRNTLPIYDSPDIGALLVLMLRNLNSDGEAYASFSDQLAKSADLLPNKVKFQDAMAVASVLHKREPTLFDNVHIALRDLLEKLEITEAENGVRWSICAFISRDQITRIGNI